MAKEICSDAGGFLAEIHSPEENNILKQYVDDEDVNEFWIGGLMKGSTWTWDHTGKIIESGFSDVGPYFEGGASSLG